jgi:hypothetical protein
MELFTLAISQMDRGMDTVCSIAPTVISMKVNLREIKFMEKVSSHTIIRMSMRVSYETVNAKAGESTHILMVLYTRVNSTKMLLKEEVNIRF